jgi:hypothetical protein
MLERGGVRRRAQHRRETRQHHARLRAEAEQGGNDGGEAEHVSEFSRLSWGF